jgi:hypothetical protein
MKAALVAVGICAGLTGCVTYGNDPFASVFGYGQPVYGQSVYGQPGYVYGQPGYVYGQRGYVYTQPAQVYQGSRWGYGGYNNNYYNIDSDGDGVPDRYDARPHDPRYR